MKVRQRRPRDAGSVVVRRRADGSQSFMLKWKHFTRTVAVATKAEATKLLPAFVAEAQSGEIERQRTVKAARNAQPTVTVWADTFLAQHVTQDPDREATRRAYRSVLRLYILPEIGSLKLHEVTAARVREVLQAQFHAGRSIRTLRLAHAVLHRLFETAIEDGIAKDNPTPKFGKLYLGEAETEAEGVKRKALSHAQITALLAACKDLDLKLYVAVLTTCGLRPGESLGLRWADIDLKANQLHVRGSAKERTDEDGTKRTYIGKTKNTSSVRVVAIGPGLAQLLTDERERQEARQRMIHGRDPNVHDMRSLLPAGACLFPHDDVTPDGLLRPTDPDNMRARFHRVAVKAGLKTTPHALRHTAISHAIEGGLSLADAAARAGHASVITTARVYVHAVSESQRKAAMLGDALLTPATTAEVEQLPNADAATSDISSDAEPAQPSEAGR